MISNEPVPWITYPAIVWMWGLLNGTERVLELGAGSSTYWFAERSAKVLSLEHSINWYEQIINSKPANVQLTLVDGSDVEAYLEGVRAACDQFGPFDIILVDGGPDRVSAAIETYAYLQDNGILLLDNSDASEYQPAVSFLAEAGLHRLDFFGPAPGSKYLSCTSAFSRDFGPWLGRQRPTVLPLPFYEDQDHPFRP